MLFKSFINKRHFQVQAVVEKGCRGRQSERDKERERERETGSDWKIQLQSKTRISGKLLQFNLISLQGNIWLDRWMGLVQGFP